jgi:lactoylglutathione lyase
MPVRFLHTMIRVRDLPAALRFFCDGLGLREMRRRDHEQGRYTLVFLGDPNVADGGDAPQVELTHNWDQADAYSGGRNFGHLAYEVDDIYAACARMVELGYVISRPPRDGRMAFVRSPDSISVELLQRGPAQAPAEPWASMKNLGEW